MSLILLVSTGMCLAALGWSLVLVRRIQDWRMGYLTVLLAFLALHQMLTFMATRRIPFVLVSPHTLAELSGLLVSIMLCLAVFVLKRLLTERKQGEDALRASEAAWRSSDARYHILVDHSLQGMYIHQDAVIRFANEAMAQTFGYTSPDDLCGQDHRKLIPTHEQLRLEAYRQARLRGESVPSSYETQGVKRDGTLIWLECIISLVEWEMRPAVMVTCLDISERKRAEEALRKSEERYRVLVEGSVQGISIVSRDGRRLFANQALVTMLGYASLDAYLQRDVLDNVAPHERDRLHAYREARLCGSPCPTHYEYEGLRVDGTPIWLERVVTLVTWGGALALMSTVMDVTNRKRAAAERCRLQNQPSYNGPVRDIDDGQEEMSRGAGRILFIDDDPALTIAMSYLLEMLGYEVVTSMSSREALDIFCADASRFDVVITDQTMPYMTGERLVGELRRIRSDIPIILCTGFSHTMDAEKAQGLGIDAFCIKPIEMRDMAAILRQVLAQRTRSVAHSRLQTTDE